jgi:hypothetical protein
VRNNVLEENPPSFFKVTTAICFSETAVHTNETLPGRPNNKM